LNPNMNVIIGKNDVGKSTILDALNIFFNEEIKADISDCYSKSETRMMEIGICFEVDPHELILLDSTNQTSLKSELLLNKENQLEIKKVINASCKSITKASTSVHLVTQHQNNKEKPLITLKQQDLKMLVEQYKEQITNYDQLSKSKKADM